MKGVKTVAVIMGLRLPGTEKWTARYDRPLITPRPSSLECPRFGRAVTPGKHDRVSNGRFLLGIGAGWIECFQFDLLKGREARARGQEVACRPRAVLDG